LKIFSVEKIKSMLQDIVDNSFEAAKKQEAAQGGYITLEHGVTTIPLPGIDVPFHSRKVLKNWEQDNWDHSSMRQKLAYTILIELLVYQFASPVRWIETQDLLFTNYKFERLIELGPSPTPTGMTTRTLKAKYEVSDDLISLTRVIYCHAKNPKEIYYQFADEAAEPETSPESATTSEAAAVPAAARLMWYDILHGRISTVDRDITARCIAIINRADNTLLEYMQYYVDRRSPSRGEMYRLGKEFGQKLIDNYRILHPQPRSGLCPSLRRHSQKWARNWWSRRQVGTCPPCHSRQSASFVRCRLNHF
jgi:Fatty acid synthase type I helical domain